jgi:hypothetical protein
MPGFGDETLILRGPSGLTDQSASGFNGTYRGGMGTASNTENGGSVAYNFASASHAITCGNNLDNNGSAAMSIGMWVKPSAAITVFTFFAAKHNATTNKGFLFRNGGGGERERFALQITDGGSTQIFVRTSANYFSGTTMRHIVATYTGSKAATGVVLYVDGSAVSLGTVSGTDAGISGSSSNTELFSIGQRFTDGTGAFSGLIDDARVANRVWTAAEVSAWYAGGRGYNKPRGQNRRSAQASLRSTF